MNENHIGQVLSSAPSRVRNYLAQADKTSGLLPHSCEIRVYKNLLGEYLKILALSLAGGAGLKAILNYLVLFDAISFNWAFKLSELHSDFDKIPEQLKPYLSNTSSPTIVVEDSLESITDSWVEFVRQAQAGINPVVDISRLRYAGHTNSKGLVASGPVGDGTPDSIGSFCGIYYLIAEYLQAPSLFNFLNLLGGLCEVIRRGGLYRNAIVTSSMNWDNPLFEEYLNVPMFVLLGSHQKGAELTEDVLEYPDLCNKICEKVNKESLFLAKKQPNNLHANVCMGIGIEDGGTCLIWRENLGMCMTPFDNLVAASQTIENLVILHQNWRNEVGDKAKRYLPLKQDNQVGFDSIGLANQLALLGFTYQELTDSLIEVRLNPKLWQDISDINLSVRYDSALTLARMLYYTRHAVVEVADSMTEKPLERIFTVEPSQRHYLDLQDAAGNTVARSIFPPFAKEIVRSVDRSESQASIFGNVEVATDVGPNLMQEFLEEWQMMMDSTGRAHFISRDLWQEIDTNWLKDFLRHSPLQTVYYQFADEYGKLQSVNKDVSDIDFDLDLGDDLTVCSLNKGCSTCGS